VEPKGEASVQPKEEIGEEEEGEEGEEEGDEEDSSDKSIEPIRIVTRTTAGRRSLSRRQLPKPTFH